MNPLLQHCGRFQSSTNRRDLLARAGAGLGMLALGDLLGKNNLLANDESPGSGNPLAPHDGHFPAKAKSVIWLFMEGAPSAVDMFDPKPELTKRDGQKIEIDVFNGNPGPLMKSPFSFRQYGESGAWMCEHYQNVAKHVDDFAFVKSFYSESNDMSLRCTRSTRGFRAQDFPAPVPGSLTDWALKTTACRVLSCWATIRASKAEI